MTQIPSMVETVRHVEIVGTVASQEPIQRRFTKTRFAPTVVKLLFQRDAGKPWVSTGAEVSGPNVKADGSIGQNYHTQSYWRNDGNPAWLDDLLRYHLDELNGGES